MGYSKAFFNWFRKKRLVKAHEETAVALNKWFDTPLGRYTLASENQQLENAVGNLFGYHLMQLGVTASVDLSNSSRINHCFKMTPRVQGNSSHCSADAYSDFEALPFEDEQVDVTVLHHVLEFSQNPHQVLKEAARVTISNGYLIIVGFNPYSIQGFINYFRRFFTNAPLSKRRKLAINRMKDWLEFLDFTCTETHYMAHNLPINNQLFLTRSRFINRLFSSSKLPFGTSYCLVARKDRVGVTPIKPKWERTFIQPLTIPEQAVKAPVARNALILPFRSRVKKGR